MKVYKYKFTGTIHVINLHYLYKTVFRFSLHAAGHSICIQKSLLEGINMQKHLTQFI